MRFLLLVVPLLLASVAHAQEPVYVVTHIDLMPAGTPTGVTLLRQFAADTLKEKGCTRFEVLQQDGRPNHLTMVGVWKDQKAFDAHDSSAYTKKFREGMQPLIGSPWDERLHKIVK
ncbi:MAG TPA: putative quinol monooxygenase [Bryobacteraceae bacterium]|jgi:quinol monooxygenase YgiN|nr:putative quinol monooxygenase [Bryobacteraceae bacterium]